MDISKLILEYMTGNGRRGNRGIPGYPVPPEMIPDPGEDPVKRAIRHVDEADPHTFFEIITALKTEKADITEKVDGSARVCFGIDASGFWLTSKSGIVRRSPSEHPAGQAFDSIREAHTFLQNTLKEMPKGVRRLYAEVLSGPCPNVIEYNLPDCLIIHGGVNEAGKLLPPGNLREIASSINVYGPRSISTKIFKFDVGDLSSAYSQIVKTESNRRKASGKKAYADALIHFKKIQVKISEQLRAGLREMKNFAGGKMVEGVVINCQHGSVKVVDRERFWGRSQFFWEFRERLYRGVKVEGIWKPGIMVELRKKAMSEGMTQSKLYEFARNAHMELTDLKREWTHYAPRTKIIAGEHVVMPRQIIEKTDRAFDESFAVVEGILSKFLAEAGPPPIPASAQKSTPSVSEPTTNKNKKGATVSHEDALHWVAQNKDKLAKRNIRVPDKAPSLGTGTRGTALDIGGGKVLKVTNDKSEAIAANKLKKYNNLKHIVRVFDVFRFPEGEVYGVLQERLTPLKGSGKEPNDPVSGEAAELNNAIITLQFPYWLYKANHDWTKAKELTQDYIKNEKTKGQDAKSRQEIYDKANKAYQVLKKFNIKDIAEEMASAGIKFQDYHAGNLMKRSNGDYVLVDPGMSKVEGGQEPDVLERLMHEMAYSLSNPTDFGGGEEKKDDEEKFGKLGEERQAETVGVTIGRFQPFHKGHAEVIREMARKYTKVILLVAGLNRDKKNPFSYDTRVALIKASLPDIEPKVEIYRAESNGKPSGFIPDILNGVIADHNSSVEAEVSFDLVVGPDRYEDFKTQMERAKSSFEKLGKDQKYLDPSLVRVIQAKEIKDDDNVGRVSATQVRDALAKNDKESVKGLLDPHLASDPQVFNDIYGKLRGELGLKEAKLHEEEPPMPANTAATTKKRIGLKDVGGEEAMKSLIKTYAKALKADPNVGIDVSHAKYLGSGNMGSAFDIGGGKVLKLTTDEKEARAAFHLRGKQTEAIARFSKVFSFPSKDIATTIFGIIEEHLTPLSDSEKKEFDEVWDTYLKPVINQVATETFDKVWEEVRKVVVKDALETRGLAPDTDLTNPQNTNQRKAKAWVEQTLQSIKDRVTKFNMPAMVDELRANQIQFADYHGGNLMKRGSQFVINDLGQSNSPGGMPPELKGVTEAIIAQLSELGGYGAAGSMDFGGAHTGLRAGSSGFSSPRNMTKADVALSGSANTWQEMIPDPNLKIR